MLREVEFTFERWADVRLQPEQEHEGARRDYAERLAGEGVMVAMVDEADHTIACGGLYPVGPGQAVAITYIGADAGPHMVQLIRAMRRIIKAHDARWPTLRAACLKGFEPGRRMLAMLGFHPMLPSEPMALGARVYDVMQRTSYGRN